MDSLKKILPICLMLVFINSVYATQIIHDDANITGGLTVGDLTAASCDVKTSTNGTLYCGSDVSGGNSTAEIQAAINGSSDFYIIHAADIVCTDCLTGTEIDESTLTGVPTYNVTYDDFITANISNSTIYWSNLAAPPSSWGVSYNATYDAYVTLNTSNSTIYWDGLTTPPALWSQSYNATYDAYVTANISNSSDFCNSTTYWDDLTTPPASWGAHSNLTETDVETYINNTAQAYFQIKSNETQYIDCTGIYGGSDADFCTDATGAAAGVNMWKDTGATLTPNETYGYAVNATDYFVNDTSVYSIFIELTDTFGGDVSGTYDAIVVTPNSSTFDWSNITERTLNIVWQDSLDAGNISNWDLDVAWSNTIGGDNITDNTIDDSEIADDAIKAGELDVSDVSDDIAGDIAEGELADSIVVSADIKDGEIVAADLTANLGLGGDNITDATIDATELESPLGLGHANITVTGDWDIGSYELRAQTLEADVATGTAPLTIASTTKVANLNVDQLDGYDSGYFYPLNLTMTNGTVFKDNDMMYFGTDYDFCIFYNSTLDALVSTNNC